MLRIPWGTDIGLAHSQIYVTLISLIAWSRSPTISAAKRLGGQRSQGISLPSWKLSHLFYIGALAFIFSKTPGPVHSLMVGARGTNTGSGEEFSSCRCFSPGNDFEPSSEVNSLAKSKYSQALSRKCGGCLSFHRRFSWKYWEHASKHCVWYIPGSSWSPNPWVIRLHIIVSFLFVAPQIFD